MISTDKNKLDIYLIHNFLTNQSGWSNGIPYKSVEKSINNSLNFGIYVEQKQIGYARVISDFSTIAYLGDIFILNEYRGLRLSKWLMEVIMRHQDLQNFQNLKFIWKSSIRMYIIKLKITNAKPYKTNYASSYSPLPLSSPSYR